MEWSAIGIICGIVSTIVAAIVTLSTIYLRLFVQNYVQSQLSIQSDHILTEVRRDFIKKGEIEERVVLMEERIRILKHKAGEE